MRPAARRALRGAALSLFLVLVAPAGYVAWRLRASLPQLEGSIPIPGLAGDVTIERDARGVPTLRSPNRVDLARGLGFVHAQDRFFQMDLLRRRAAGELAELLGPALVDVDREARVHRFRARAAAQLAAAPAATQEILRAYVEGVNAGLTTLRAAPPEYLLLRAQPVSWRNEDTYLVVMAMYLDLQAGQWHRESDRGLLEQHLPRPLVEFLAPGGTEWDAPLLGGPAEIPALPGPEVVNLQEAATATAAAGGAGFDEDTDLPGSNNFAVAGSHTASGSALLANDMHLGLGLPNIWYRASLVIEPADGDSAPRRIVGVTLPGTPAVVVGSNGDIAWGFTNSYGDFSDLIVLEDGDANGETYRTPAGPRPFERHEERIRVRGSEDVSLEVLETLWGPVVDRDAGGRRRALRWVAHHPEATDLELLAFERARTVDEALDAACRTGLPAQNLVVADRAGAIGWTVMGRIPRRERPAAAIPVLWSEADSWHGWLEPGECPRVARPPAGRLWTANNRVGDAAAVALLGDGSFDLGVRAGQIRDDLLALERVSEADLLGVQLDDRARLLEGWRSVLLDTLTEEAVRADARRAELRSVVAGNWTGRASVDSAAYRLVRAFRLEVGQRVFAPLVAPAATQDPSFRYTRSTQQWEGPLWRLVTERPMHLLDPGVASWQQQCLGAADAVIAELATADRKLAERTWGERNTVRLRHALSAGVPWLARWLDLPGRPLPGDDDMPRVQSPRFGASERMVVAPGHEERAIFHMPGGQSGHFLSPYYRAGHEDWETGRAAPLLPGPTVHRLVLVPASGKERSP